MRLGAVVLVVATACGSDGPVEAELPAWSRALPAADVAYQARRGLVPARGIIHLHSPYSHDACDGEPRDEDTRAVDEDCLASLRAALCDTRVDFAALTDHDDSMAEEDDFETLFSARGDDVLLRDGDGVAIASRMTCPSGHTTLIYIGGENRVMPIMIDGHPDGDAAARADVYNGETLEVSSTFRDLGGMVWIPHAEERTTDLIRSLQPDGLEIYQLHANIDPNIRKDYLGLDSAGAIQAVAEFADTNDNGPEPDLALMAFIEENAPAITHWDTLLGEGMRLSGTGGTDAHENSLPIILKDGERGDSYRRMIRWFGNIALTTDPDDPDAIEEAIRRGRFFVSFDLFGTPQGFDFAGTSGSTSIEMGDDVAAGEGATLELTLPSVYQLDPSLPAPVIRGRIWRIDASGKTQVAEGPGPTLSAPADAAGAYRAEVLITPHHYGPYLRRLGTAHAEKERVWVYSNPIYVTP